MGDHEISRSGQETQRKRIGTKEKLRKIEVLVGFDTELTEKDESNGIRKAEQKYDEEINSLQDFIYRWALEVAINERQKNDSCLLPSFHRNSTRTGNNRHSKEAT